MQKTIEAPTRMDRIQAPIVAVIGALIRQVPGTISLGQGVVHYPPPPEALDAVRQALSTPAANGSNANGSNVNESNVNEYNVNEYNEVSGVRELVEAIGRKLAAENGIDVALGSRVMVTAGANMAFMNAVLAITSPGDEIVLPVPFYFNHEMAIEMAGCRAIRVPTDDRYQLDLAAIERAITARTRAIVTISPNNPSGAVLSEASLRAVNELCRTRGMYHISDEPYEYFTYGTARHVSPGSFAGANAHTISMYSLSKAYGFAGWRIGYVAYPEALAPAMLKVQDTILICPTIASQIGAIAALGVGRQFCTPHVRELESIRDIVVSELSALGPLATVPAAEGAFYCLLRVNTTLGSMTIAERLIREHQVAVIPGFAFGMTEGCYFRVAYGALQIATVREGVGRLVEGLKTICS